MKSEFGKGLCYCLGLFLAHANDYEYEKRKIQAAIFFNVASDHLYELEVNSAPKHLRARLNRFKGKCLDWGHGAPIENHMVEWAIQEAKDLLRLIDKANGVNVEKGYYE